MCRLSVGCLVVVSAVFVANTGLGDETPPTSRWTLIDGELSEFARRVFKITDVVLDNHIEPPTRQEMLLCGLTALHGDALPDGLSRSVSAVANEEDFVECLLRYFPEGSDPLAIVKSRAKFLYGLERAIPGGLEFQSAKEAAVARQLAANQYIGIGIRLGKAKDTKFFQIAEMLWRGPAAKAGIEAGEFIVAVDGTSTWGLSLEDLVDRLRGPEGTTFNVGIARDVESKPRTITLTRSVVPRQTVVGLRELEPEKWECVVGGRIPTAYLKVREITGGTVAELREYEADLAAKNVSFIVLDLRGTDCSELRHALHFADALLNRGSAGTIRLRGQRMSVPLDRDWLFTGWPMAVLVNEYTSGFAEWLAGLLQQYRGAMIVGRATTGERRFISTPVELPNDWGVVRMATGVLERETAPDRSESAATVSGEPVAQFTIGAVVSFLFRDTVGSRQMLNRPHAVIPDVMVEGRTEVFDAPGPDAAERDLMEHWLSPAIKVLKDPAEQSADREQP